MNETPTNDFSPGQVRIQVGDAMDHDPGITWRSTTNISAATALTHLIGTMSKLAFRIHRSPEPGRVVIGDRSLNKYHCDEYTGSPNDLRPLYQFALLYLKLESERGKALNIAMAHDARVRKEAAERMKEAQKRDCASARRGIRGKEGPATPLDWRQRTLLGYSTLKCALLERLGVFDETNFNCFGGLTMEQLIELVEYKTTFPETTIDELKGLVALAA